jgi:hypothetical protein
MSSKGKGAKENMLPKKQ